MNRFVVILTTTVLALAVSTANADPLAETAEVQFTSTTSQSLRDKATALDTPALIYQHVRNTYDHALYQGSRSGSLNTFLGMRGNDVDLASTLIAMLRYRGVPARYAVGTVRLPATEVQNWLAVKNLDLAKSLLIDMGLPNVSLATDRSYVDVEHVWVEALVPFGDYRGAGPEAGSVNCSTDPSRCIWVGLDPSYKLRRFRPSTIDIHDVAALNFDYTGYYNAIKNAGTDTLKRKDKNPLAIYEEQILTWLRANHPGKTLEDVADAGEIVMEESGILPSSLPYQTVGTIRRYDSVALHDAQVPSVESRKWAKYLRINLYSQKKDSNGNFLYDQYDQPIKDKTIIANKDYLLADLATRQLTLTFESSTANCTTLCAVVRLDKVADPVAGQPAISYYDPLVLDLQLDGALDSSPVKATYYNLNAVGGYYLIGTGGETSNWSQVHRAAADLLAANDTYRDVIANGTLHDNKNAMDALTGGLLYTSMNLYYSRFRDAIARLSDLNHVKTPIVGFVGVVSSVYDVEFVDGTAFSVLPGGLLIDMKGQRLGGTWRDNAAATRSNKTFDLIGHIMSSFEHEIWQELTGYDAVSTVRGIQMAMSSGAQLANPKKIGSTDTLPSEYSKFGFDSASRTTFTDAFRVTSFSLNVQSDNKTTRDFYTQYNQRHNKSMEILKKQVSVSTSTLRRARVSIQDYSPDYPESFGDFLDCYENTDNKGLYYVTGKPYKTIVSNYKSCGNITYTGNRYSYCDVGYDSGCPTWEYSLWHAIQREYQNCYLKTLAGQAATQTPCGFPVQSFNFRDFLNTEGSDPYVPGDYVARLAQASTMLHSLGTIASIRDNLYLYNGGLGLEYVIPSQKTQTPYNMFMVYIAKQWSGTGNADLAGLSFNIQNWGGGYVEPPAPSSSDTRE